MEISSPALMNPMMTELSGRYSAFVRCDPRLQHYLDAIPQAMTLMEHSLNGEYQTLHPLFPRLLPLLAISDDTPQKCKFAPPALDGWSASRRKIATVLHEYYDSYSVDPLRPHLTLNKVNQYLEALTERFSEHVRACMCLDRMHFYEHPMVTGEGNKEGWPMALSIDTAQLRPLMEQYGIKNEDQFLRGLGVKKTERAYTGVRDEYNRYEKRIVIADPKVIGHLKELGVQVEPSAHVYQISHDMREKHRRVHNAEADDVSGDPLAFDGIWARKVFERRERKLQRQEAEPAK